MKKNNFLNKIKLLIDLTKNRKSADSGFYFDYFNEYEFRFELLPIYKHIFFKTHYLSIRTFYLEKPAIIYPTVSFIFEIDFTKP